jgi:hypothetical protein
LALVCLTCQQAYSQTSQNRWSVQKAQTWYQSQPWLAGSNYIPASAINQIEMWSRDSFDHKQIEKELAWAKGLGFNTMRVFLSSVVWRNDAKGMKARMNQFLDMCQKNGIRPLFVFFDDCWNAESSYGKQPEPKSGIHNSGWVQDPSVSLRADTVKLYSDLSNYVKDILTTFKNDKRILLWDLYNEPGNSSHGNSSLPLLRKVFEWAREVEPSQPVSSGYWDPSLKEISQFQLSHSDVITYHDYDQPAGQQDRIKTLRKSTGNRPLLCTEYMARTRGCKFQNVMPILKENGVAAINWGFVSGKTNTIFAWDTPLPGVQEPKVWFHDIYRQDGTPFDQAEIDCIKGLTKNNVVVKSSTTAKTAVVTKKTVSHKKVRKHRRTR